MSNIVLVPLATGFEEIEAVTIIDVLRRAECQVQVASITDDRSVVGAHGIAMLTDINISDVPLSSIDAIVLPGGLPGSTNLLASSTLKRALATVSERGGLLAAICAAPQVLAAHGFLEGVQATCYPGVEEKMHSARMLDQGVVVDHKIITGRGIGSALDFSLAIVTSLCGDEVSKRLRKAMVMA